MVLVILVMMGWKSALLVGLALPLTSLMVLAGMRLAAAAGPVDAIGIDSWAVDYGLLDRTGALIGNPVSHRDPRTDGVRERVVKTVPETELYATTGLQQLPFNTLYQLVSAPDLLERAETMLLVPDLLAYWLTGVVGAEHTNASTTQLYDVRARSWAGELAARVGVPTRLLPPLREPGSTIGTLLPSVDDPRWHLGVATPRCVLDQRPAV